MKEAIQKVIKEEIDPILKLHNGACELDDYADGVITLRLTGGCVGCPSSKITLFNGIMPILQERFPELTEAILHV